MEKYETEFKLKVVKSFLAGEGGAKLLARRWSVPLGKYWHRGPFVFSFVPLCYGLQGSGKKTRTSDSMVSLLLTACLKPPRHTHTHHDTKALPTQRARKRH
jgi:hypothetical protein